MMKKVFLNYSALFIFFLSPLSSYIQTSFSLNDYAQIEINKTVECKHGQCNAIAKSTKKRCKHCVSNSGDKKCWHHK